MPRSPSIALMVSCLTRAFRKRHAGLCRWHPGDSSTNTETLVGAVDPAPGRVMVANRRGSPTPRKVVERHLEPPAARKDHRALDQVRELADVPGPRVPTQRVQRLARDDLHPAVHGTREPLDEVAHQGGNRILL